MHQKSAYKLENDKSIEHGFNSYATYYLIIKFSLQPKRL